jgi:tetratricopeptide (TPR) repeat protein
MAQIKISDNLFVGRIEEQKIFRNALLDLMRKDSINETFPYVFMLSGMDGMGKTGLARRFQKMALEENPFKARFKGLWLDWEKERRNNLDLLIDSDFAKAETIFDIVYNVLIRNEWGENSKNYLEVKQNIRNTEREVSRILGSLLNRDDYLVLRTVSVNDLADLVRLAVPLINNKNERIVASFSDLGIDVSMEQAASLCSRINQYLQSNLLPEQYQIYVLPEEQLAEGLAKDLKEIADKSPIVIIMDQYDLVYQADYWLRLVQKMSAPQIVWVICSRQDLVRSFENESVRFRGYIEDYPRRLLKFELLQLSMDNVLEYLTQSGLERFVNQDDFSTLYQTIAGIPFVLRLAAELLKNRIPVSYICGDVVINGVKQTAVKSMIIRYLSQNFTGNWPENGVTERLVLYALALAEGDEALLDEMIGDLITKPSSPIKYKKEIRQRYIAILDDGYSFHNEVAAYLLFESQKQVGSINQLNRSAEKVWRRRIVEEEQKNIAVENCCQDDVWCIAVLRLCDILFGFNENDAWQFFIPHFVESLAYRADLTRNLVLVAQKWKNELSSRGRNRVKKLATVNQKTNSPQENAIYLDELEQQDCFGLLKGEGNDERSAILALKRGQWCARTKQLENAVKFYQVSESGLPPGGIILREQLADAMDQLAVKLIWPDGSTYGRASSDAVAMLERVIGWFPEKSSAWYRYGAALKNNGNFRAALAAYLRAINLEPQNPVLYNELGDLYAALNLLREASDVYWKALDLDNNQNPVAYNGLGNIYAILKRDGEAIIAYNNAIVLDSQYAAPNNGLGNVYRNRLEYDKAILAYQRAIGLAPDNFQPYHSLADVYFINDRLDLAKTYYQKSIGKTSTVLSDVVSLAVILYKFNQTSSAAAYFTKALELVRTARVTAQQTSACILINKATAQLCLGQADAAITSARQATAEISASEAMEGIYLARFKLLRQIVPQPPVNLDQVISIWETACINYIENNPDV